MSISLGRIFAHAVPHGAGVIVKFMFVLFLILSQWVFGNRAFAASANGMLITSTTATITDTGGYVWTISTAAQVVKSGVVQTSTHSVNGLLYYSSKVYQRNTSSAWAYYNGSTWTGVSTDPRTPSSSGTTIAASGTLNDGSHNVWSINSSGQIVENGVTQTNTSGVTHLEYYSGVIYQENTAGKWYSWNGLAWAASQAPGSTTTPVVATAFYVATTGSDSNAGTSAAPFATVGKALTAMHASATIKTTYIKKGTYKITEPIVLTSSDNGETISYNLTDGYNTAVFDGQNEARAIFAILGGMNITINGIKMQNTIQFGIYNHGGTTDTRDSMAALLKMNGWTNSTSFASATGNVFENNEITDITIAGLTESTTPNSWISGCIYNSQLTPDTKILNNYCHNVNSMGIYFGSSSDMLSQAGNFGGTVVSGNFISNTCLTQNDCGAIYAWNPNSTKSTLISIKNNYIKDYSVAGGISHAIYLDYETSNVSVSGNVVMGSSETAALMISDGNNNKFSGNIFDLQNGSIVLMAYINITGHQAGTGNTFTNNVVLLNAASLVVPTNMNTNTPFWESPNEGALGNFTVQNNFYCNYHDVGVGPYPDTGNYFNDASPHICATNPGISATNYSISSTSPVFSSPVSFPALVRGWGPPGFAIPTTGSVPAFQE